MACVRKYRDRWVIDYLDRQGRRHIETVGKLTERVRREAERQLRERLNEVEAGRFQSQRRLRRTLDDYIKAWLIRRRPDLKPMTWEAYQSLVKCHIGPGLGFFRFSEIDLEILEMFKSKLIGKVGNRSVNAALSLLGTILEDAVREGYLPSNPTRHLRKLPVPRREMDFLSPIELQSLLSACEEGDAKDLIVVGAMTGIRRGEMLALRWHDLDFDKSVLHVRRNYTRGQFHEPKTQSSTRAVSLAKSVVQILKERYLRKGSPSPGKLLFDRGDGRPIDPDHLSKKIWRKSLRAADLRDTLRWHDLRHTYASLLLEATGNMKLVQEQLGHSGIQVTMDRYAHLLPQCRENAMVNLERLTTMRSSQVKSSG